MFLFYCIFFHCSNNNNKKLIKKYKEAFESRASESLIRKGCNAGDKMDFEVLKMLKPISTRVGDALSVKGSKTVQFQSLFYFHLTHFLSISQNLSTKSVYSTPEDQI